MTDPYVIIVEITLRSPADMPEVRKLIDENAVASAREEAGCRRFDVAAPNDAQDQIILYEVYENEAAFAAHLETDHYRAFDAASARFIAGRRIRACTLVCEGSKWKSSSEG